MSTVTSIVILTYQDTKTNTKILIHTYTGMSLYINTTPSISTRCRPFLADIDEIQSIAELCISWLDATLRRVLGGGGG